jgi:hypothetical protein
MSPLQVCHSSVIITMKYKGSLSDTNDLDLRDVTPSLVCHCLNDATGPPAQEPVERGLLTSFLFNDRRKARIILQGIVATISHHRKSCVTYNVSLPEICDHS